MQLIIVSLACDSLMSNCIRRKALFIIIGCGYTPIPKIIYVKKKVKTGFDCSIQILTRQFFHKIKGNYYKLMTESRTNLLMNMQKKNKNIIVKKLLLY